MLIETGSRTSGSVETSVAQLDFKNNVEASYGVIVTPVAEAPAWATRGNPIFYIPKGYIDYSYRPDELPPTETKKEEVVPLLEEVVPPQATAETAQSPEVAVSPIPEQTSEFTAVIGKLSIAA